MRTFDVTLVGYDGTGETDHLVKWVNAPNRTALGMWLGRQSFKVVLPIDDLTQMHGSTKDNDQVDLVLDSQGNVLEGEVGQTA